MFKYALALGLVAGLTFNLYSEDADTEKLKGGIEQQQRHKIFSEQNLNDGTYQVRIMTDAEGKKVTVKQGDKVIAENLEWSKINTLPEEVQNVLHSMDSGIQISAWGEEDFGNVDIETEIEKIFKDMQRQNRENRYNFKDFQKEMEDIQREMEKYFPQDNNWKERGRAVIEMDKMFDDLFKNMYREPDFRMNNRYNRAFELFNNKEFKKASLLFLEVAGKTRSYELKFSAYYNAACAYALSGDQENAETCLKASVSSGYRDFEHMLKDEDLKLIRETETFKSLIGPYKVLKKAQENLEKSLSNIAADSSLQGDLDKLFEKELGASEKEVEKKSSKNIKEDDFEVEKDETEPQKLK